MPVKTATLDLGGDGYEGFTCVTRTNVPMGVVRRFFALTGSGDETSEAQAREDFLAIFPDWDFVDDKGKAIPHTAEGVDSLPDEMLVIMLRLRGEKLRNGAMPGPLGNDSSDAPSGLAEASKPLTTT
jgi:hypothetical protein